MKPIFWEVVLTVDGKKVEFYDLTKKQFRELITKIVGTLEEDDFSGATVLQEDTEQVSFYLRLKMSQCRGEVKDTPFFSRLWSMSWTKFM